MHTAFEQAGQTVKLILHQGPHITPTMANKNYGILIDGKFYDDIVNEWISHYLYGVENSAEEMPEVLAQTNYDQKKMGNRKCMENRAYHKAYFKRRE